MERRSFIKACALGGIASLVPLPALAVSQASAPQGDPILKALPDAPIIIQKIEILHAGNDYFLRATAADGRVGMALCDNQIVMYAPILKALIIPFFIGKDARDLETLIDGVYVYAANYKKTGLIFWSCVAWIEFSLLDLLGQATGKSIGQLFGPLARTEVPVYLSSTSRDTTPSKEVARFEKRLAETGCRAIKYKIGGRMSRNEDAAPGRTEELVALARKTFPKLVHYADANGSYDAAKGIEIGRMLEDRGVKMYEEPCPFDEFEQTKAVADALKITVSGGEQDTSPAMFRWMIQNRGVDVVQPDIVYNGGFVRAKRVGRLARRAGLPITLHAPTTGIQSIYMIHFASSTPNAGDFQEYHINPEQPDAWSSFTVRIKDGKVPVPQTPGKGFEIDPAYFAKADLI